MKVYIITSGEYSSYRIESVAATLEDALSRLGKIVATHWVKPYITEWDTDTGEPVSCPFDRRYDVHWDLTYKPALSPDVTCSNESRTGVDYWCGEYFDVNGIRANDETHAIKIAAEIKAQFEAEWEGLI